MFAKVTAHDDVHLHLRSWQDWTNFGPKPLSALFAPLWCTMNCFCVPFCWVIWYSCNDHDDLRFQSFGHRSTETHVWEWSFWYSSGHPRCQILISWPLTFPFIHSQDCTLIVDSLTWFQSYAPDQEITSRVGDFTCELSTFMHELKNHLASKLYFSTQFEILCTV